MVPAEKKEDTPMEGMMKLETPHLVPAKTMEGGMVTKEPPMRMINDVLVEPRRNDAPTKRRKRRARRTVKQSNLGNIRNYFASLYQPKECSSNDVKEGGAGALVRKRKYDGCMETSPGLCNPKSRRIFSNHTHNRPKNPNHNHAKITLSHNHI